MRASLARWIGEADVQRHLEYFRSDQAALGLSMVETRADDYYLALVDELFERMRVSSGDNEAIADADGWARLGNALAQYATCSDEQLIRSGVSKTESLLYSATAFYMDPPR